MMYLNKSYTLAFLLFFSSLPNSYADLLEDSNAIFDWAELEYAQYFPIPDKQNPPATQTFAPYYYRYYPASGIYLGVKNDGGVYVMGGNFGDTPL